MRRTKIAFLVYAPERQRRADNSFDGNDNIGARVIADCLSRAGFDISYCAPETAKEHDVVLVSFTSTYDLYAFAKAVMPISGWMRGKRRFKVVGGGFGMQNPHVIKDYIDYAVFGRAEAFVEHVIDCAARGVPCEHESVMNMPEITPVKIAQADALYPHCVGGWQEEFIGCPLKCRFCHYTWARKRIGVGAEYVQKSKTAGTKSGTGGSPEILWRNINSLEKKPGRIRTAIDGFSERLRFAYGKPITDTDITAGIEYVGHWGGITTIMAYNIGGMPTETREDREALYSAIRAANPVGRVIFVLTTTPFRPSLATPLQWAPADIETNWNAISATLIEDRDNLRAIHSFANESPWSHIMSLVAERAGPSDGDIFKAICFSPKLKKGNAEQKIKLLKKHFDLTRFTREYDTSDPDAPGWWLTGYVSNKALASAARVARGRAI